MAEEMGMPEGMTEEQIDAMEDAAGTAAEEGLFYKVPNVSLRMATERPETVESGATIVSGMNMQNIVDSVETATTMPWSGNYELEEGKSPSAVVINTIRTQITNFF